MPSGLSSDPHLQKALGVVSTAPKESGEVPNERERKLGAMIHSEATRCQGYLYPFHRQWYVNIAAATGAQGAQAETIARLLRVKVKQVPHRVRHQTNVIGGACRRLVGYLSRSNPDLEVVPGDLDNPLQMDYAKAAHRYLEWQRYYDQYRRKELEAIEWAVFTGIGLVKSVYDHNGGPVMEAVDEQGMPLIDRKTGEPLLKDGKPLKFTTGMPTTVVVPSFHLCYGIEARSMDELSWIGEDGWFPFSYLEELLPGAVKKFKLMPEAQYQKQSGYYYRQVSQTIGPAGVYAGLQPDSGIEGVRVLQFYVRPYVLSKEEYGEDLYHNGCFGIFSQGRVIHMEPNPYLDIKGVNPRFDWHPYSIFPCYTFPGRFLGQGVPENLIPLQEAINFINSRVRETQRTMGQPKWFVPEGSNVAKNKLTGEANERITYNQAHGPPIAWTPPAMPAYIFNMLQQYYSDVDSVASQPPMAQGRAEGQIRSGMAVQALQEQALTEFTPILSYLDEARSRHARQTLLREIQNSEFPRRVQWRGSQGWEQEEFFGKMLSPDFMVSIKPGTSIPRSKALAMSEIDRMVAWGVLMPQQVPQHAEIIARTMEYNVPPITPENDAENISSARYVIARMIAGEEVAAMPTDNHRVYVNEMVRFMQSRKYRELAEQDPTLHERFMYRLGKHRFYIQMQQIGQDVPQAIPPFDDMQQIFPEGNQQIQAMTGGGGGGGGQGMGGQPSTGAGQMNPAAAMPTGGAGPAAMGTAPGGMSGYSGPGI